MPKLTPYHHPNYHDHPKPFPPDYANAWGYDSYGVWIELNLFGVVQRFRWIPAGRFTMGSPENEAERETFGKETVHEQGFG